MRGMGHSDPIETVAFKHEEGNEGKKIGVKRRIGAFYGGKLLKRQGEGSAVGTILTLKGAPLLAGFCKRRPLTALRQIAEARGGIAKVAKPLTRVARDGSRVCIARYRCVETLDSPPSFP
jgi:hypothetical protein